MSNLDYHMPDSFTTLNNVLETKVELKEINKNKTRRLHLVHMFKMTFNAEQKPEQSLFLQ